MSSSYALKLNQELILSLATAIVWSCEPATATEVRPRTNSEQVAKWLTAQSADMNKFAGSVYVQAATAVGTRATATIPYPTTDLAAFMADLDDLMRRMEDGIPYSTDEDMIALADAALKSKVDVSPEEWAARLVESMGLPRPG